MTVITVTEAPSIVCPPWCSSSIEEHLADLTASDNTVVHFSAMRWAGSGCDVRLASTTFRDGTPDPSDPPHLFIEDDYFHEGATLEAAKTFAEGILAALREMRA